MPQTISQATPQNHVLNLLTFGKLHSHLADVEEEAQSLFLRLVKEYAENEGVTEKLKAENPMEWIRRMNSISFQTREIVNQKVIYFLMLPL